MNVSVVIPVYRNQDTVLELHRRLSGIGGEQRWGLQQIFVDDRCPESSRDALAQIASADSNTIALGLRENVGQQGAVAVGASYARGDVIAFMDADLQDRPEDLPLLVNHLDSEVDLAVAVRSSSYQSRGRMATSRIFKRVVAALTPLPPQYGMFLAVRRRTLRRALRGDAVRSYLPVVLASAAGEVVGVPIERVQRPQGESACGTVGRLAMGALALRAIVGRREAETRREPRVDAQSFVEWSLNCGEARHGRAEGGPE